MNKQFKVIWVGCAIASLSPLALAVTHNFTTPGAHSFTVPAGVTSIQVELSGAGGGAGTGVTVPDAFGVPAPLVGVYPGGSGGSGARVLATLAVVPGDVVNMIVADSGKGGTLHRSNPPPGTGAGGIGSGSGGTTTNSDRPSDGTSSLTGGGGGGASLLSVGGTFIRAGGGGGGGGAHRNQATFSHAESGAAGLVPAATTTSCSTQGDGLPGTVSQHVLDDNDYQSTGSGGGGGGGYAGQVGAGGVTPGLIFGQAFPQVEFAPTGGGGGGSCTTVAGSHTLTNVSADTQGGAGGVADPAPISTWDVGANMPAPIDGSAGWARLTVSDTPVASVQPVPSMNMVGLALLSVLTASLALWRQRRSQRNG